jgi:WD40 repeat protein
LVSKVAYDKKHGDFLFTAGYDKKLHIWKTIAGQSPLLIKTLGGHEGKLLCNE